MEAILSHYHVVLALLAVLLPVFSFLRLLFVRNTSRAAFYAVSAITASFVISAYIFFLVWNRQVIHEQTEWFAIGHTSFTAGILINILSALMMLLVTGISLLVHIYSLAYMKNDPLMHRYIGYLGLFCGGMLLLVIADNLLTVYMAWELVGFSSYLLIGFWFTKDAAARAARKAFIINRMGDIGFLIGLFIIYTQFGTFDILKLFGNNGLLVASVLQDGQWVSGARQMPELWLTVAGMAFFMGAAAKSAQFPMHTWLPDAMEGPTSVSALIHAATMVAAGVFLVARIFPLFNETVLIFIACTGLFTAFMAATIALTQNDIKRILAFSTISQLGFMMLSVGTGAVGGGIFHLATHAFFKCLLFLAAGAVIHELGHVKDHAKIDFDTQDIRLMGGLRKRMPITFYTMAIASIALVGLPFTSGFLSKDAILIHSFEWASTRPSFFMIVPFTALVVSWMTAFYIARLIFKVFFGEWRLQQKLNKVLPLHESPPEMKYPMLILAACSFFPLFSFHPFHFESSWILSGLPAPQLAVRLEGYHAVIPIAVNLISILVIGMCYHWYGKADSRGLSHTHVFYRLSENQWYFDRIYDVLLVRPVVLFSGLVFWIERHVVDGVVNLAGSTGVALATVAAWFDTYVIDATVNGAAEVARWTGNVARHFQTGRLHHYLVTMLLFVLAFFVLIYFRQLL